MKKNYLTTVSGITLTELLIALIMTGAVMAAALSVYTTAFGMLRNTLRTQTDTTTQATEIAMDTLVRDFQTANKIISFPGLEFFQLRRDCNCAEVPNNTPWDFSDDTAWWYGTDIMWWFSPVSSTLRKGSCGGSWWISGDPGNRILATDILVTQATPNPLFAILGNPRRVVELQIYPTPASGQKRVRTRFTIQSVRALEEEVFQIP